jgi:branched-subunit amino acid transport protein AzlD
MYNPDISIAIFLMAFIILFTRFLPFMFFRKKYPTRIFNYLENNIPPLVMLLLVMYCLRNVKWGLSPFGLPEIIGIATVVMLHLWRNNSMLSIVSGTILYMLAVKIL